MQIFRNTPSWEISGVISSKVLICSCLSGSLPAWLTCVLCSLRGKQGSPLRHMLKECQDKLGCSGPRKCLMSSFGRTNKCLWRTAVRHRWSPLPCPCPLGWVRHENTAQLPRRFPLSLCTERPLCLGIWAFHHPSLCAHLLAPVTSHQTLWPAVI